MGTRISQQDQHELETIAVASMTTVHPIVVGASRDQDFIINIDQLPNLFTIDRQRTLKLVGACMVSICKLTCDT